MEVLWKRGSKTQFDNVNEYGASYHNMTVDSSGRKSDFDASSKRKQFQFNSPSRIESDFVLLHILGEGTTSQGMSSLAASVSSLSFLLVRKAERKQTNIPYAIKTLRQELSADSNLRHRRRPLTLFLSQVSSLGIRLLKRGAS